MSNKSEFKKLFQPIKIGKMKLVNRLVMPSMGNNYGSKEGYVTERLIDYYVERATDGPGLIITEMVSMDEPTGRRGACQLRIDNDSYIEGLSRLTQQIHECNRKMAIQLCHAGILAGARVGELPLTPSPVENFMGIKARELTIDEIEHIITQFVKGALRAKEANFDGIEIHAAHSYLLAFFLSPVWNKRQDQYGGSVKNRARILVEVISRVRKAVGPRYPLWCRMNGKEFGLDGGLAIDESKEIALMAEKAGCNALHISAGGYGSYYGYNRACMGNPMGNMAELAADIKKVVSIPVIAVGRINLQLGEKIVSESKADLIAIGRGQIADPNLIKKASEGKFEDIRPCISCNRCVDDLSAMDIALHCSVNACVGKEHETKITPSPRMKKVLVIGGGPGGMEAAIVASQRGHQVTIFEQQPQLGGKLILAAIPPGKDEISFLTTYLISQIKKSGINLVLNKIADSASITNFKPDVVILATGARPYVPRIPGGDRTNVVFAEDILAGKLIGQKFVVIGGGLVGCETAEFLVARGKAVTIVEMLDEMAMGVNASPKVGLLHRLKTNGVKMLIGMKCRQIGDNSVVVINKQGLEQTIEVNTVVLAVGAKSNNELFKYLNNVVPEIHLVGDCVEPRRILDAISDGHSIGLSL